MSSAITLTGRLTAAPDLRFSPSGVAVAAFTIVTSRRVKDQATGDWSDADTTYWDCKAFKQLAENVCESLDKGLEVIAVGRVVQESWDDKQTGQKRSKLSVRVDSIGPSLRSATAKVTKAGGSGQGRQAFQEARQASSREGLDDPWATSGAAAQAAGEQSAAWDTEPPF